MSPHLKKTLHRVGNLLALLGIAFVGLRLRDYSASLDLTRLNQAGCLAIVGFAFAYGLANILLASAWWHLLRHLGSDVSLRKAIFIYGKSQLAKYVPGNIFHLAGRQALGMAAGVSAWALAKSSLWELALLSLSGAIWGLLVLPQLFSAISPLISVFLVGAAMSLVVAMLWRTVGLAVVQAILRHFAFLASSASIFVGLICLLRGNFNFSIQQLSVLIGAYILAWLIGLVTPGAPAGVGVREMVLLFLLKGQGGETDLLLAVVLGRVVSVSGDVLMYFFSILIDFDGKVRAAYD